MSAEFKELLMSFSIIGSICGGMLFLGGLIVTEILIRSKKIQKSNVKFVRMTQLIFFATIVFCFYWLFTQYV